MSEFANGDQIKKTTMHKSIKLKESVGKELVYLMS